MFKIENILTLRSLFIPFKSGKESRQNNSQIDSILSKNVLFRTKSNFGQKSNFIRKSNLSWYIWFLMKKFDHKLNLGKKIEFESQINFLKTVEFQSKIKIIKKVEFWSKVGFQSKKLILFKILHFNHQSNFA